MSKKSAGPVGARAHLGSNLIQYKEGLRTADRGFQRYPSAPFAARSAFCPEEHPVKDMLEELLGRVSGTFAEFLL